MLGMAARANAVDTAFPLFHLSSLAESEPEMRTGSGSVCPEPEQHLLCYIDPCVSTCIVCYELESVAVDTLFPHV